MLVERYEIRGLCDRGGAVDRFNGHNHPINLTVTWD